jgi:hypothetical protein
MPLFVPPAGVQGLFEPIHGECATGPFGLSQHSTRTIEEIGQVTAKILATTTSDGDDNENDDDTFHGAEFSVRQHHHPAPHQRHEERCNNSNHSSSRFPRWIQATAMVVSIVPTEGSVDYDRSYPTSRCGGILRNLCHGRFGTIRIPLSRCTERIRFVAGTASTGQLRHVQQQQQQQQHEQQHKQQESRHFV